jgi:hypothetical protein
MIDRVQMKLSGLEIVFDEKAVITTLTSCYKSAEIFCFSLSQFW